MSRGIPSWMAVSGLTAGAMVVVSVLALQANGTVTDAKSSSPSPTPHPSASHSQKPTPPPPVPTGGDTGKRIVYSIGQHRVWVVPKSGPVATFLAQPGTVPPTPGVYYVSKRVENSTGSDGAKVEHVVFFEYSAETWVAFSAPLDDNVTPPPKNLRTGAIRVHRADELKLWNNTVRGSTVVVVK